MGLLGRTVKRWKEDETRPRKSVHQQAKLVSQGRHFRPGQCDDPRGLAFRRHKLFECVSNIFNVVGENAGRLTRFNASQPSPETAFGQHACLCNRKTRLDRTFEARAF